MASILDLVKHYQHSIEKYQHDEKKVLKCIDKLYQLGVTVQHLQETGVGRTVNALRKEPGDVGTAARALVNKWKLMVASEETSEPEDHVHDTSNYNGHGNGKDSDDNLKQSRNERDKSDKKSSQFKQNEHGHKNGDDNGNKRKYHSSEDSEPETKKTRHSHSSETEDTDKSGTRVKEESHSESNDSQSDSESDSESSASSEEDTKIKQKIKTEPIDNHRTSSSKHSSYHHQKEIKKEPEDSSRNSHSESSHSTSKHHSKESRHSIEKSSSKDRSSSSHKSSSKDKESSEKKHKSDKEKSSSSKHNSSTEKSKSKHNSDNEKQKSQSEKQESKSHKHRSSSHSHKSDKEKVKSSSDKDTKEKHKTKESSSSSKHSSSDKEKSRSSSSKEKSSHSSSKSEKKHSSSNDVSKSKSKASDISEKESTQRQSSSTSQKSKSSSSRTKEDVPKKNKAPTNSEESEEDGIDCGTGASFAEALGMISPTKGKKKSVIKKTSSPNNPFLSSDLGPASLLAPTTRLAPLPPLEISALPEISPNYKPRPPPKLLPHFTDEETMSHNISSKTQRTKVYSGNKMYGKLPSLYELCVNTIQEHIDALEYTGGVPYEILKPVVDRTTPEQLFTLEHYNPYLMEDTDHLWQKFCAQRFRNKPRQEFETWREMYNRCMEEQEHKLKSLTANIKMTQEAKKAPIKQTKMAYVDSVVKPPRNVARKQALHGTARAATASPAARVAALAVVPGVVRAGTIRPPNAAPVSVSSFNKPKKAPLMQKALQFMRGRKR